MVSSNGNSCNITLVNSICIVTYSTKEVFVNIDVLFFPHFYSKHMLLNLIFIPHNIDKSISKIKNLYLGCK